jgi:acyl carrier protein
MTVLHRLQELIRELLNREDIALRDESVLADIPGWDSLMQINLIFGIEQQFGFRIEGRRMFDFVNIGDLRRYIEKRADTKSVIVNPR